LALIDVASLQPLCDIDILNGADEEATMTQSVNPSPPSLEAPRISEEIGPAAIQREEAFSPPKGKHATLATPAVRHLTKELNVDITQVRGTGKEGRVTKEDIHRFVEGQNSSLDAKAEAEFQAISQPAATDRVQCVPQKEEVISLTPVQAQMFKAMTRSLTIPHFLYADEVSLDSIIRMRSRINTDLCPTSSKVTKLSFLPFIIKAVSLALEDYPILNSRVDSTIDNKPRLVMRPRHNIGVAMDTPQGLLVPNIKDVGSKSILEVAGELQRLQAAGASGKLSAADLIGGTISVSNIGNLGGTYVAPVIVTSEVAILGIGRAKTVPAFDATGAVVPRTVVNMSWSADHRVVDGGTMARMANQVKQYTEEPELMIAKMR
jgi:2-oxoisovalerate dehydrogenase E2 component (dihydrolipoyl transacylase)